MTTILLVEDQGLMRSSLEILLTLEEDFDITAVGTGPEALPELRSRAYDIALLDIHVPPPTGLDLVEVVSAEQLPTRCIIITTFSRPGYVRRAMDHGAAGFLIKDQPIGELADAIRRVAAGEVVIPPDLAVAALRLPPNPLSSREIDVLRASADDHTIDEIALHLHLAHSTARNYLSSAIQKLQVTNRASARQIAEHNGWL
ncbi:response regulator transcription factor [Luteipulveratus mongoliensis]|uniref:MerR family transcriptional regulator n=1 Tax=Luteipulveratus mongoliensis TaxID=571913 RepID=A0A0K1JGV6_9MICO|nr:response regulator transcription factor [Luteipulveratus mongoliensis]AKU15952.1 MerR family transcriptional regulator [Luteipulveratus mongoliensis]